MIFSLRYATLRSPAGAVAVLVCFGAMSTQADAAEKSQQPVAGRAATSVQGTPGSLVLPAEVVAYQSAVLTAKVAGYLKNIPVDKGDRVKAGALIAEIEVPELLADRLQYRAQVDVAKREYERMQQAAKTAPDLVTPDSLDNARGRLEVAQAQLDRIGALLAYATITAPFSGTITARYVDPGAYIPVPSQSSQQSAAIVTLMDFRRVRIQMWVPESEAAGVRPGCKAVFTAASLAGKRISTQITRVGYALERNARTMLAEIEMENPGEALQPGMYLSVELTPGTEASISAPQAPKDLPTAQATPPVPDPAGRKQ